MNIFSKLSLALSKIKRENLNIKKKKTNKINSGIQIYCNNVIEKVKMEFV